MRFELHIKLDNIAHEVYELRLGVDKKHIDEYFETNIKALTKKLVSEYKINKINFINVNDYVKLVYCK